jgi:SAM-dependent methyltransferase
LDMRNIDYAQADILKVGSIQREFDVIEAGGILHHLEDPFAGWRALVSRLRPHGFMYVGLYSAIGRQRLVAARAFIAERGYQSTADDIRRFRQDFLASELEKPLRRYCRTMDFFNISGCRDLFFHVQEHRHNLAQVKAFLDDNGLDFLGFVLEPQELQRFYARFPGETVATNLELWQIFEAENPDFFSSMYHMWLRKRASAPPVPALN